MGFYDWKPEFTVQVNKFDEQHKKLISLINQLHDAMKAGKATSQLSLVLDELDKYTQQHFKEEEMMMERYQYPGLPFQKQAHAIFIKKISEFKNEFQTSGVTATINVMNFLKEWLTRHILDTDKKYGPFFKAKGLR
ncbi:hemerythrin family protein [candidate division KSB1 bacterium]|nr:hemerythrin family protein [candidate division KSB1 bacterium]